MPARLSSNNYSEDWKSTRRRPGCPVRRRPGARSRGDPGRPRVGRPRHHYPLVGTSACPDRQTVGVIYVHRILSVLSARRVPRRLFALMKKSAHETVDAISHVSIHPARDSILHPPPLPLPLFTLFPFLYPLGLFIKSLISIISVLRNDAELVHKQQFQVGYRRDLA